MNSDNTGIEQVIWLDLTTLHAAEIELALATVHEETLGETPAAKPSPQRARRIWKSETSQATAVELQQELDVTPTADYAVRSLKGYEARYPHLRRRLTRKWEHRVPHPGVLPEGEPRTRNAALQVWRRHMVDADILVYGRELDIQAPVPTAAHKKETTWSFPEDMLWRAKPAASQPPTKGSAARKRAGRR